MGSCLSENCNFLAAHDAAGATVKARSHCARQRAVRRVTRITRLTARQLSARYAAQGASTRVNT